MKKTLFTMILPVLIFAMSCSDCQQETQRANEIEVIENLLDRYLMASENQDYATIESIWAKGDSIMLFGTDSNEKLMGWNNIRNAFRRQFSLISNTYIAVTDRYIKINCTGNTAWFALVMNYNFMNNDVAHSLEGVRFTGVLEKQDDNNWKMVQGHLSMPANLNIGRR
jgi:ketosteroid isomerase-like protein